MLYEGKGFSGFKVGQQKCSCAPADDHLSPYRRQPSLLLSNVRISSNNRAQVTTAYVKRRKKEREKKVALIKGKKKKKKLELHVHGVSEQFEQLGHRFPFCLFYRLKWKIR